MGDQTTGGHDYARTNVLKLLSSLDPGLKFGFILVVVVVVVSAKSLFRPVTKRGYAVLYAIRAKTLLGFIARPPRSLFFFLSMSFLLFWFEF